MAHLGASISLFLHLVAVFVPEHPIKMGIFSSCIGSRANPFRSRKKSTTSFSREKEPQILPSSTINTWTLCALLRDRFKNRYQIVMENEDYHIWAPRPLTPVSPPFYITTATLMSLYYRMRLRTASYRIRPRKHTLKRIWPVNSVTRGPSSRSSMLDLLQIILNNDKQL